MSFWNKKKVLLAGGAGFIGSYLTEQLLSNGAKLTVVDSLEKGNLDNLKDIIKQINFLKLDLRDINICSKVTKGMDVVMNLAARAYGLEYSFTHHGEMLTSNLLVGLNLLESARANGVERFLVVSSSCIYPDDALVPTPEYDTFTKFPEAANQGYGWAKRILELQGIYYSREYKMKIAIGRPFNAYGIRDAWVGEKSHVIPALIKKLSDSSKEIVVWGSGNQKRSFIHGQDVAAGLRLLTENYPVADPVNVGSNEEISIRDLVFKLMKLMGVEKKIIFDTSKPEGCFRKSADISKLNKISNGFSSSVSLEKGLQEMVEWYKKGKNNCL